LKLEKGKGELEIGSDSCVSVCFAAFGFLGLLTAEILRFAQDDNCFLFRACGVCFVAAIG